MKLLALSVLACLVAACEAAPASTGTHVLHEKRDVLHPAWKVHSRAPRDYVMPMRFALKQRNLEHAERYILEVSDPASPSFGKHWTAQQVADMFAPAPEASDRTLEWLVAVGISPDRLKHSTGKSGCL